MKTYEDDRKRALELDRKFAAMFCDQESYSRSEREEMRREREAIRLRSNLTRGEKTVRKIIAVICLTALLATPASAVYWPPKPPPIPHSPQGYGLAGGAVGVLSFEALVAALVGYDLVRRSFCIGDPLRLGGPGFSEPMPTQGNVLVPKCMRP